VRRRALGQAMAMATVRAGDVIVRPERLAHTDRDRLFSNIEVSQSRHQRACIQIVHPLFEQANGDHLTVPYEAVSGRRDRPPAVVSQ
jgi:hypothetical protein